MATTYETIHKILDKVDDDAELAAEEAYNASKKVVVEVLRIGMATIAGKRRRLNRRQFKRDIVPKYQRTAKGGQEFTASTKKKLASLAQKLFGPEGWKIGRIFLIDFTKEQLLAQVDSERLAAQGHEDNADFYEALAEPMKSGQKVRGVWKADEILALRQRIDSRRKPRDGEPEPAM